MTASILKYLFFLNSCVDNATVLASKILLRAFVFWSFDMSSSALMSSIMHMVFLLVYDWGIYP